ncbi:MAG TPA: biopolymer transporter ExbD [Chthoniobacteraceae bacterium]|nr:biopolymer transporter ExbD [Chthoniobacteraceae bacterium]
MIQVPSPRSKKRARIEIIPLIDIIFFLLATFVMVSLSMVKNLGVPVNLPAAATGAPQSRDQSADITIDAQGKVFFNKQPVDDGQLDAALKELIATSPDPRVFISGDTKAEFGRAIAVLDEVRKLGITKVAIETQPKPAPSP